LIFHIRRSFLVTIVIQQPPLHPLLMLAGRNLLHIASSSKRVGVAVAVTQFSSSSASQPSPSLKPQPAINSTFVTVRASIAQIRSVVHQIFLQVSNGGIVPISKEQYMQLNARPKRMSKVPRSIFAANLKLYIAINEPQMQESIAFSSALFFAVTAGFCSDLPFFFCLILRYFDTTVRRFVCLPELGARAHPVQG
jgi:hypothetical protein